MGWDLTLRMDGVKRRDLLQFLKLKGFVQTRSVVPQRGFSYFYWFDELDHKSLAGVEATLIPGSRDNGAVETEVILGVHCKIWASVHDVAKMNEVVRGARRQFGGQLDGDYGKNRYIPLWEDHSTPLSRGVTSANDRSLDVLESLRFAIPKEIILPSPGAPDDTESKRFFEVVRTQDPARIVFNGLIPMIVAVLEHYFLNVYLVLAEHDEAANEKLRNKKTPRGVSGEDLFRLAGGDITPQGMMARDYSFQSVHGLSTTYWDWFGIDLKKILAPKKKVLKRNQSLLDGLANLIKLRHGVVHRLDIDRTLGRAELLYQIEIAIKIVEETTAAIGRRYSFAAERP